MELGSEFGRDLAALEEQLVAWRRDFHAHPELGLQEIRSAGIIAAVLRDLGYRVQTGVAQTGVVALLEGRRPGPVVMVRVDMDALPIQEQNQVPYASCHPGLMHACGHDAHMAIGLGVATAMAQHRDEMTGTLKLVFQPGEEGMDGALRMVDQGVLDDPHPDVFLSTHVWADSPVGTVNVSPGPVMAAADKWTCIVRGKGGHGAMPHQTVDPVVATAHIVTALQTIVSRNVSPLDTAVVTVGAIHGGDAFNIVPAQVALTGTVRSYDACVREHVLRRIDAIIKGVSSACGVSAEFEDTALTPAVVNDPAVAAVVHTAAEAVVGLEKVLACERTMGSEDAALFMQDVPGCYFFLGSSNVERGLTWPLHNPRFDVDEAVLPIGVAVLARALAHYL
jgi:amidohydrolase